VVGGTGREATFGSGAVLPGTFSSSTNNPNRGFAAVVPQFGFLYVFGGTSTGSDALTSTLRTF
jgi:hypothetical protein